jgi:hypothetical protein
MKKLVFYEIVEIGDYGVVFILKGSIFIFYILGVLYFGVLYFGVLYFGVLWIRPRLRS